MIKIKVPSSSANLGPGFDTLAMALGLYSEYSFEIIEKGIEIISPFQEFNNPSNLVYTSLIKTLEFENLTFDKGIRIKISSDIPISRGLGSSASCILGGVSAAYLLSEKVFDRQKIFDTACRIEGHCDNVAAQLFGGITTSVNLGEIFLYEKINIKKPFKIYPLIPDFRLETKKSREILPKTVSLKDAVSNIGNSAMLITSLINGNYENIKHYLNDKIHQPYRASLVNGFDSIKNKALEFGAMGVYLSGAGPTVMTLKENFDKEYEKNLKNFLNSLTDKWDILQLELDTDGLKYELF